jgi:hypothetical protein
MTSAFVIGDPHFKKNNLHRMEEYIEKLIPCVSAKKPTFIVILGDTLHEHSIIRMQPYIASLEMIDKLREIAHVYLLIGNHDMLTGNEFLTGVHSFYPLRYWENVTIVDKPIISEYGDKKFLFCPYVPRGRFIEALNTTGDCWEFVDCIFAHQEIKGCRMGSGVSIMGDTWSDDYPPIISGHMHCPQKFKNVHYPGGDYVRTPWLVTFDSEKLNIQEIDLGVKERISLSFTVEEAKNYNPEFHTGYDVKIKISGTDEEISAFKKSATKKKLDKAVQTDCVAVKRTDTVDKRGFSEIFEELVRQTNDKRTLQTYSDLFE